MPAAHTTSPAGSTATHENCTGDGALMVRKLRYRMRSSARTVPSSDAVTSAWPEPTKSIPVTGPVCSEKVTKQKPLVVDQTLTLPSSPPGGGWG